MSQNDSILILLGITDEHITVQNVFDATRTRGADTYRIKQIDATLSYTPPRCPHCGMATMIKYGSHRTNVRLPSLNNFEYHLHLRKQRFRCKNCATTCNAHTPLVRPNHQITTELTDHVHRLAQDSMPVSHMAKYLSISASSVARILHMQSKPAKLVRRLPENLCFDEFKAMSNTYAFISIDAVTHNRVCVLPNRQTNTIIHYFKNHYSNVELASVKSVTVDLNAQYVSFIHRIFPHAKVVLDRFHIVQLAQRALSQSRIQFVNQLKDPKTREYKLVKSQWRLFNLHANQVDDTHLNYLYGINEYMTKQNAIDLVLQQAPRFAADYLTYQALLTAMDDRNVDELRDLVMNYQKVGTQMDIVMKTFKSHLIQLLNSLRLPYSNGPIEGFNRKIKQLSRGCYGFRNLSHLFDRIALIHD